MEIFFRNFDYLLSGAVNTVWMAGVTILLGSLLGLLLAGVSVIGPRALRAGISGYIFVIRGIPVLVLMFVCYYAMPAMGWRLPNYVAVTIALVFYSAAFYAELIRGALEALPRGQSEAAKSLGMRRLLTLTDVLLPQIFRPSLPPWLNTSIVMVKSTAYASIVGAWELTYAAREVVERTLAAFEIFTGVMLMYFVICYPLSLLSRRMERRSAIVH